MTPILVAFSFVSALELVVVHLLLPWETIRLIVLVLSIWGLLWMIGYLASMKVFPHLLDDHGLRVRYGTTVDIPVPWEAIAGITSRRRGVPSRRTVEVKRDDDDAVVDVAVLKQTRVDVVLRQPTAVALPDGVQEIVQLRLYVDDHRAFVAAARKRLPGQPSVQPAAGRR